MKKEKLKNKIMNLIIGGFPLRKLDDEFKKLLKEGLGGVILYEKNCGSPQEVRALTDEIASVGKLSPIIFVDQEGGRVRRLKKGYTPFPSQWIVGRYYELTEDIKKIYQLASAIARELRESGINANLSPVIDILDNPENTVIGDRAFSSSAITVSELGLTYSAAFQDEGIISCAKHFPGHGSVKEDSHEKLPVDNRSTEEIMETSLKPFWHLVKNRVFSIMTAHILYPEVDPDFPATLSKKIIMGFLRKEMSFDGLVISDDLTMKAITSKYSISEAAVLSINAGLDMIIIPTDAESIEEAVKGIYDAVKKGKIPEDRLNLSSDWISEIREEMTQNRKKLPPLNPELIGNQKHREIAGQIEEYVKTRERRKVT